MEYVLVTGCLGMIGSKLTKQLIAEGKNVLGIDRVDNCPLKYDNFCYVKMNLNDKQKLGEVFNNYNISKVIHLAALAHRSAEIEITWEKYYEINVVCSENIFDEALKRDIPVLFISTVDVFGITDETVDCSYECRPISDYAKSKLMAEKKLKELTEKNYGKATIFRLSPVYTDEIKRDIQKRYYLKYPKVAYRIGKGTEYEFLYIDNAVKNFIDWINKDTYEDFEIKVVKDEKRVNTALCIEQEKKLGNAKTVIYLPRWAVMIPYKLTRKIFGEKNFVYMLNKVVNPLKTK